ncbi:MAG TPA: LPS assembly lipoprotein LptE [Pirellulaceae bacterium]|nr:LPS assembly lipoprotein LptE [Pirellulaceae bacterium]
MRSPPRPLAPSRSLASRLVIVAALLLTFTLPGCATYRFGNRSLYRCDIRTVHVPMVQSDSFRRNLGERLTEAIVKEIELKTQYKVVDAASADSVLTVRLISESKRVLSETRNDDPRDLETDFFAQMSWADRRGDLIAGGTPVPFSPLLVNISQAAGFVPEGGQSLATAQQEAIQRMAEQIVGQMEAPW